MMIHWGSDSFEVVSNLQFTITFDAVGLGLSASVRCDSEDEWKQIERAARAINKPFAVTLPDSHMLCFGREDFEMSKAGVVRSDIAGAADFRITATLRRAVG